MKTLFLAIAISLVLTACGGSGGCDVTYEVSGNNRPQRVLITMAGPNGSVLQGTFPVWPDPHKETYRFNDGDFLYISGQNSDTSFAAGFAVRILVDGVVKDSGSGSGYSVASAESVCR